MKKIKQLFNKSSLTITNIKKFLQIGIETPYDTPCGYTKTPLAIVAINGKNFAFLGNTILQFPISETTLNIELIKIDPYNIVTICYEEEG